MSFLSIFNLDEVGFYTTTKAVKSIFEDHEYKNVRIDIVLTSHTGKQYQLGCTYSINIGGKISKCQPVKFLVKIVEDWDESLGIYLKEDVISRKRCYLESEIDEITINDIDMFNRLFDNASKEVKRLYN